MSLFLDLILRAVLSVTHLLPSVCPLNPYSGLRRQGALPCMSLRLGTALRWTPASQTKVFTGEWRLVVRLLQVE